MRLAFLLSILFASLANAQNGLRAYQLHVEKRFGAFEGPGSFAGLTDAIQDRAGNVYAADPQADAILVFDSSGKYVRSFGRSGRGPGDLNGPSKVGWRGDSLWIAELTGRVSIFHKSGRFVRIVFQSPIRRAGIVAMTPGGKPVLVPSGVGASHGRDSFPLVVAVPRNFIALDTLVNVPRPHISLTVSANGRPVYGSSQPFSDDPIVGVRHDGTGAVIIDFPPPDSRGRAHYRARFYDFNRPRGDQQIRSTNLEYQAVPLTREHIDQWLAGRRGQEVGPYFPKNQDAAFSKALYKPKWLIPVSAVMFSTNGHVWLRKRKPPGSDGTEWLLFDRSMQPFGELKLKRSEGRVVRVDGNVVWLVQYDDLDVPFLVRARLAPGARQPF